MSIEPLKQIGTIAHSELGDLFVYEGITEKHIDRVVYFATTDEAVRRLTSDARRFKNRDSFNQWLEKSRTIYTLTDNSGELFGIIWFGIRKFPDNTLTRQLNTSDYPFTFSIRLYDKARGKGLARRFMQVAFDAYMQTKEYLSNPAKGFWLDTPTENLPAINAYERFGFEIVSEPSKKSDEISEIVMVLKKP